MRVLEIDQLAHDKWDAERVQRGLSERDPLAFHKTPASIARALAANPKFILLDEPFTGVDPKAIEDIEEIIKRLAEL